MSIKIKVLLCLACMVAIIYAFGQTPPSGIGLTYALASTGCSYMSNTVSTICGTPSGVFFATSTNPAVWQSVAVGTPGPQGPPGGTPASFSCDYTLSTVSGKQHINFTNCQSSVTVSSQAWQWNNLGSNPDTLEIKR